MICGSKRQSKLQRHLLCGVTGAAVSLIVVDVMGIFQGGC